MPGHLLGLNKLTCLAADLEIVNFILYFAALIMTYFSDINSPFIQSPFKRTIREHQTATLTCLSGASQPLPSVIWEKNNQPIADESITSQYQIVALNATSATIELKNVSIFADTGSYRCVATNPLLPDQPVRSESAFLLVQRK